jgi:hypothetical protein
VEGGVESFRLNFTTDRHSPVLHTPVHVPLTAVSKQLLGQAPFVRAKLGMLLHTADTHKQMQKPQKV